jgi:ligand-binding sensor domain-containing protein
MNMNISKCLLSFCFLFTLLNPSDAQEWTPYKSIQQVNDFLDTGTELYMATNAGLVVVDKNTLDYSIYGIEGSDLSNDHFQSVARASNGDTFIGTYDVVVARFDGSGFQDTITPDGLNYLLDPQLYDIKVSDSGELWVATSQGVFRQVGSEWFTYNHQQLGFDYLEVWDIEFDAEGAVYIGAGNGVHKFENETWTHISEEASLTGYLDADVYFSKAGDLFFSSTIGVIGRYDGETWTVYNELNMNGVKVNGFTEDANGNIYLDTDSGGVYRLETDTWVPYENEQITQGWPWASFYHIDEEGVHWLSKNIYLYANEGEDVETIKLSPTTIEYNYIYNIRKGMNGELFFLMVSSTNSISVLSPDGDWSLISLPFEYSSWAGSGGDILYHAENDIWVSHIDGMYHFDGTEWTYNELVQCKTIVQDSEGIIYVSAIDKVYIIEDEIITEYNESNSPLELASSHTITSIGVDIYDNLWLGMSDTNWNGNHKIQKVSPAGDWTTYSQVDHPKIKYPRGEFHFDVNGNVWVPSRIGVIKFDGENFSNPIDENSLMLEAHRSYAVESDASGKVYIATTYGIVTLFEEQWEEWYIDGLPLSFATLAIGMEFDDSGRLWWGSAEMGLYTFTPAGFTNTNELRETLYSDFSLYPNPTRTNTTVTFSVLSGAEVSLAVYNNLGQQVRYSDLGFFKEGYYEQGLDLGNYPSGIYTVHLRLNDQVSVAKLVLE